MRGAIQATRMELLRRRRRLALARRGHRLLENKRDELMRHFLGLIEQSRGLREEVEQKLAAGLRLYLAARAEMPRWVLEAAFLGAPRPRVNVEVENVMSVPVPHLSLTDSNAATNINGGFRPLYGWMNTPSQLDEALLTLRSALEEMLRLAQLEQAIELLAEEIERTRRRVNALEQRVIPRLEEEIRYIQAALDEMERAAHAQLRRIKGAAARGSDR